MPNSLFTANLQTILHREGVMPRETVDPAIWKFTTSGTTVTLPYCWHSAVDGSAAALLCSVDSYDMSRDEIRFLNTRTNYPDLETVAQAIKHAQARDPLAVRGYCATAEAATALVQFMPASYIFASEGLKTIPGTDNKETVALSTNDFTLKFELMKMQGRWLVSHFTIEKDK
jgi:hypothetical protein